MRTLLEMIAGVALVVWGTDLIKIAAIRLLGVRLQHALEKISKLRAKSLFAGGLTAILLQSSNAASLIFCSFLARGAITVEASVFALLGANIGTSIVARLLTFDVGAAAASFVIVGAALHLKEKGSGVGHFGRIVIGLGLILIGLRSISAKAEEVFRSPHFSEIVGFLPQEASFFVLIGALLTIVCYSSLATVVVAAELVNHGSVDLLLSAAIVLGANIGTGLSAAIAARAYGVRARWVSAANLGFRVLAAMLALVAIAFLWPSRDWRPPGSPDILMYGHMVFNVLVLFVALPLVPAVSRWVDRVGADDASKAVAASKYLSANVVSDNQAISDATREVLRISNRLQTMLENSQEVVRHSDRRLAEETAKIDAEIDVIYAAVRRYLNQMSLTRLGADQLARWHKLMLATINFEHAADILERNLRRLELRIREQGLIFTEWQIRMLVDLYDQLSSLLRIQTSSLVGYQASIDGELSKLRQQMNDSVASSIDEYIRVAAGGDAAFHGGTDAVYFDLVSDLQHIARLLTGRSAELSLAEAAPLVAT
jgi:phosphate:Na+ symporter